MKPELDKKWSQSGTVKLYFNCILTIFIAEFSHDDLFATFSVFGPIRSIKIFEANPRFAIIRFRNPNSVMEALGSDALQFTVFDDSGSEA